MRARRLAWTCLTAAVACAGGDGPAPAAPPEETRWCMLDRAHGIDFRGCWVDQTECDGSAGLLAATHACARVTKPWCVTIGGIFECRQTREQCAAYVDTWIRSSPPTWREGAASIECRRAWPAEMVADE